MLTITYVENIEHPTRKQGKIHKNRRLEKGGFIS